MPSPRPCGVRACQLVLLIAIAVAVLTWVSTFTAADAAPEPPRAGAQAPGTGPGAGTAPAETPAARAEGEKEVRGYTLPPEKYRQAVEYSRAQYRLYFLGVALELALLLALLALRVAPRYRDLAERLTARRFGQAVIYTPLLLLTLAVLELPVAAYGQRLALKYEQSVQGWGSWLWDWLKSQTIGILIFTLLIWILYAVVRRSPRRWWFYFWLAAVPILIFVLMIEPLVIRPLFFKFEPLATSQPELVKEIGQVVERGGLAIPPERMFEMKASEKLRSLNAYVAGFGPSKRVVVWDTTIQKMTPPQILFVFGHEMGHYVLHHVIVMIVFLSALMLVFLYLGFRGMHRALARWGDGWSIRGVADWASLPVLWLFLTLFGFLASPVVSTWSRHLEHDADIYGLEVIHGLVPDSGRVAGQAFQVLGEIDLADPAPGPFIKIWLFDHPPLGERVVFAQQYDPWSKGQTPRFVH